MQEGDIDMSEIPNEIFQPLEEQKQQVFRLGTVTNLFENGTAQVLFDGETEPSQKQYAFLSTYRPAVDDRVFLAAIGGTYVILGAISHEISQDDPTEGKFVTLNVSDAAQIKNLNVSESTELKNLDVSGYAVIEGILNANGNALLQGNSTSLDNNYIGFFGRTPVSKPTVQKPVRNTSVPLETKVKDLSDWIDNIALALERLGLINIQYKYL